MCYLMNMHISGVPKDFLREGGGWSNRNLLTGYYMSHNYREKTIDCQQAMEYRITYGFGKSRGMGAVTPLHPLLRHSS